MARTRKSARVRVGISGWRYAPWRAAFYPPELPHRRELEYAASIFQTIEINGSFYSLQRPESWKRWYAQTPDDFQFAVKGPRYITHMLKLRGVEQPLANFLASGVLALKEKLGPILWQFPAQLRFDPARFESFIDLLPDDTAAALKLARRRHPRMHGKSVLAIDEPRRLRHAMEVRHESYLDERFIEMLRARGVALVIAETAKKWPMPADVTADFVYIRLHGDRELYRSGYGPAALARWAERIEAWHAGREPTSFPTDAVRVGGPAPHGSSGRDVYCYFDNTDDKLRAPPDARALSRRLGLSNPKTSARRERRSQSMAHPAR